MTWPAVQTKVRLDSAADDPKLARSELATNVDLFNQLQAHVSSYIQGMLDDADAAAARTTLGLVIGTNVQAFDATLASLAAVAGVAGDILYASGTDAWARLAKGSDGEVLTLASGIPSWATLPGITRETALTTTSGTTKTFTGISAGTNRITVMLDDVSLSGSANLRIRIGDAGGIETSDYVSGSSAGTADTQLTTGFIITNSSGSGDNWSGLIILTRIDGNTWVSGGNMDSDIDGDNRVSSGIKTLTAELTQIELGEDGSSSFDAGKVNIFTE